MQGLRQVQVQVQVQVHGQVQEQVEVHVHLLRLCCTGAVASLLQAGVRLQVTQDTPHHLDRVRHLEGHTDDLDDDKDDSDDSEDDCHSTPPVPGPYHSWPVHSWPGTSSPPGAAAAAGSCCLPPTHNWDRTGTCSVQY